MANEIRSRTNLVSGTLSVGLSNVDTTMSSAGLASLATITAANHAAIIIESEIIYVTAHTAAATTATILRAPGSSAASHALNVAWQHGPVMSDYDSVLGYAQAVAAQSGITAETDLTNLSVTVTVPYAGHRIKISASGAVTRTAADGTSAVNIKEGATQLCEIDVQPKVVNDRCGFYGHAVIVPTAASHTYKLTLALSTGTGTTGINPSATNPVSILVEDLGPAL